MAGALSYTPFDADVLADPFPFYARLRDEAPVYYNERIETYVLSRYEHVVAALRDWPTYSSEGFRRGGRGGTAGGRTMIFSDPPDHTKLRRLVTKGFTARAIADLEPRVREIAETLVTELLEANEQGAADFVAQIATPLPITVIGLLLGIPPERNEDLKRWSDAMIGGTGLRVDDQGASATRREILAFFGEVVAERSREPGDDLISTLVTGPEPLTFRELLKFCTQLLIAGNETTTALIGNWVLALDSHRDELRRLQADPTLVPAAVEEAMRFDSPVQTLDRTTTEAVEVDGVTIPADARVLPLYASANRDPRHYPDADRYVIDRNPKDHVAFGTGIHFCLGAPLARLELRVLADVLFRRVRDFQVSGEVVRTRNPVVRGVLHLPVTITPA